MIRMDGPAIHTSMLAPLLIMAAAFTAYYVTVLILRLRRKIERVPAKPVHLQTRRARGYVFHLAAG